MSNISDYDKYHYDYSTYWKNRDYENESEKIALKKLLAGRKGNRFIDIGGSFGRLTNLYSQNFNEVVILDYSFETLKMFQEKILAENPNTTLIAANAYKMPFKAETFDGGMMIRVLHHINNPDALFTEVNRIIAPKGFYIQEFANKLHIKARIKWLLKFDFKMFSEEPYQQPFVNAEGTKEETVFLNFHPKHIKKLLENHQFKTLQTISLSFFRIPLLKRLVPSAILLMKERFFQIFFSWTKATPSVIYLTEKLSNQDNIEENGLFCCPECKSELHMSENEAKCQNIQCSKSFARKDGIWDFRVE